MGQTGVTSLMKGINHPSLKMFIKKQYLGRGGFGHVWKVLFSKGNIYLAMKQISKSEISKKNFTLPHFGILEHDLCVEKNKRK